jgi:ribosomal protein S18 acetylase RimI-like enzyme
MKIVKVNSQGYLAGPSVHDATIAITITDEVAERISSWKASELWQYDFWSRDIKRHCGCARLGIAKAYQKRGLAEFLFSEVEKDVLARGYDGIGFLVSPNNPKALAVYARMNYDKVGQCVLYEQDWFCYEKKLK